MSKSKIKIIGTGLSGLVGSRVVELLKDKYDFEDLSLETGVDITDKGKISERVSKSNSAVVLHMAAFTDVDGCEQQRKQGEDSLSWRVNVEGTKNIVRAVKDTNKRLIHISTDFVFSGLEDKYTEESKPNPINWYGETKFRAELAVQEELENYAILRLAFPYRAKSKRPDIVRRFLEKFLHKDLVKAVNDIVVTPTFIDDVADVIMKLLETETAGIYHVVGSDSQTPLTMAETIAEVFNIKDAKIYSVTLDELNISSTPRPRQLVVLNDKITKLGVKMKTFREGIEIVKLQLNI